MHFHSVPHALSQIKIIQFNETKQNLLEVYTLKLSNFLPVYH